MDFASLFCHGLLEQTAARDTSIAMLNEQFWRETRDFFGIFGPMPQWQITSGSQPPFCCSAA